MYKNRINQTASNLDLRSFIQRCDIAYDERARYVEFVCNVWNEGRFGPDLAEPVTVNWNQRPELESVSFLDLDDNAQNGPKWSGAIGSLSILGRAGFQAVEAAFQRAKQMGLLDRGPNALSSASALTPNQGRGSP